MKIKFEDQRDAARGDFDANGPEATVSDDFFSQLLNYSLERGYLEPCAQKGLGNIRPPLKSDHFGWCRITRLPVHPSEEDSYDLLSKWQSTLSFCHLLGYRIAFVLQRHRGQTGLYLGAASMDGSCTGRDAAAKVSKSASIHMHGIGINLLGGEEADCDIVEPLDLLDCAGIVTGIPSRRGSGNADLLQTLDKLAYGLRNEATKKENDYSLVVVADPVRNTEITALMGTLFNLQTEIHDKIACTSTQTFGESQSQSSGRNLSVGIGSILLGLCTALVCVGSGFGALALPVALGAVANPKNSVLGAAAVNLGGGMSKYKSNSRSFSTSSSVSRQYLNYVAKYCEDTLERHVRRLEKGRNLGFWNTGIYVLGDAPSTTETVLGMLRSIYAGDETYVEPIRAFDAGSNPGVLSHIRAFSPIPLPVAEDVADAAKKSLGREDSWNVLGPLYQSFTTPLNTDELSIATSLPRRDVPGLKFVKNAVNFAANPPAFEQGERTVRLGAVMDVGAPTEIPYAIGINQFVRHCMLAGISGGGKTTTSKTILARMMKNGVPFLVIEPTKTEYLDWACELNQKAEEAGSPQKIRIFTPGCETYRGTQTSKLVFNLFEPCAAQGAPLKIMRRIDSLVAILSDSMPMGDVLPMILEEGVYELAQATMGESCVSDSVDPADVGSFPDLGGIGKVVRQILQTRRYETSVQGNIGGAIETRIASLQRGWKKEVFNAERSIRGEAVFEGPAVINLNGISNNADKALFMSILLTALREYRESVYETNDAYRAEQKRRETLKHFTVVEEAHRIMAKPAARGGDSGNARLVTAEMFCEILSEIRAYGEGVMIVDQIPSKLIPEAIKNTNIKIAHRIAARDDREAMGETMGLRPDQEDIIGVLEQGNAIVCSEQDDAAMWVKIDRIAP